MGSTSIKYPSQPATPTVGESINDWLNASPRILDYNRESALQEAQTQADVLAQYGLPIAQQYQAINEALYPGTAGLQEQLASIAAQGMHTGLSPEAQAQYRSDMSALMGSNVGSPIGAEYTSRNMALANEAQKQQYQNLALSLAGRQPLAQGNMPQYTNMYSNFTPTSVMGFNQGNYGTQANMWNTMAQGSQSMAQMNSPYAYMMAGGNLLQGIGDIVPG